MLRIIFFQLFCDQKYLEDDQTEKEEMDLQHEKSESTNLQHIWSIDTRSEHGGNVCGSSNNKNAREHSSSLASSESSNATTPHKK